MQRKNGRAHGEVFTKINVVQYILNEVGYISSINLQNISIIEPSSGHGVFGIEILKRLFESSKTYNFAFLPALIANVKFTELNPIVFKALKKNIENTLHSLGIEDYSIVDSICLNEDFLESSTETKYHCIVGNPPYIRHELISAKNKLAYKLKFGTFRNRADLYIPFFEHGLNLLIKGGSLCFICSNRWLYNQYGKPLRELISKHYNLKKILNIEQASPFDESVIAYPCISTISNDSNTGKVYYYETDAKELNFGHLDFKEIKSPITSSWQNMFLQYDMNNKALSGLN